MSLKYEKDSCKLKRNTQLTLFLGLGHTKGTKFLLEVFVNELPFMYITYTGDIAPYSQAGLADPQYCSAYTHTKLHKVRIKLLLLSLTLI